MISTVTIIKIVLILLATPLVYVWLEYPNWKKKKEKQYREDLEMWWRYIDSLPEEIAFIPRNRRFERNDDIHFVPDIGKMRVITPFGERTFRRKRPTH